MLNHFRHLILSLLILCALSFNNYALANHTDTTSPASCPDIEVNGGQSLTYWFKDYYTQKPYQGGQIVPIGTRLLHFIRAEAYGHCEMLQKEAPPGNGCFTFINVERKVNFIFSGLQFPNGSFGGFYGSISKSWEECGVADSGHILESGITPCNLPRDWWFLSVGRYHVTSRLGTTPTACLIEPSLFTEKTFFDVVGPNKSLKCPHTDSRGNPCSASTGNKHQQEEDYTGPNLPFTRFYNSQFKANVGIGYGWMTAYHKRLVVGEVSGKERIILLRANGASEMFSQQTNGSFAGDSDTNFNLVKNTSEYIVTDRLGNVETYNVQGLIQTETDSAGNTTTYAYNSTGQLTTVTGPFGHQLQFTYNATHHLIETATLPDSTVLHYSYQQSAQNMAYNLTSVTYPDSSSKTYHYEDSSLPNHLTGITDQNGIRFATWTYDAQGRALTSEHAVTTNAAPQERFLFSWGSTGDTTVTDPKGNKEVFKFITILGVKKLTEKANLADNKKILQTFDGRGNLTSHTNEEGRKTTYTYNTANQRLSMTEAVGTTSARTTNYTYYSNTVDLITSIKKPSVVSGNIATTTIDYNADLLPERITQAGYKPGGAAVSRITTLNYNSYGQITSIDGPRGDVNDLTTFTYHSCTSGAECGRLATVTNALNQVTTYQAYDGAGRVTSLTDAVGLLTQLTYDALGRIIEIKQTSPNGVVRTTDYSYNTIGKLASVATPAGTTLTYSYDNAHNLSTVTDNLGNSIKYKYDLSGNLIEEKINDPSGTLARKIQNTYDVRNNLQTINFGGSLTQLVQDAIGNLRSVTDANSHITTHEYNSLNQLTRTIDALSSPVQYSYDKQDNVVSLNTPNGATTTSTYDDLGNLLSETSPDRGITTYSYDQAGNQIGQTDARGVITTMTYDALNRILTKGYPGSNEDVTYAYDSCLNGIGHLCSITDESGTTTYSYNVFGNIVERIQTIEGVSYTTQFTYNADNRVTQIIYPTGHTIAYSRDALGRISAANLSISGQTQPLISNVSYTPDGLLRTQTFGNGLQETRSYNGMRLLENWQLGSTSTTYTYDAVGNMLTRASNTGTQTFTYDSLDRLLTDAGLGQSHAYTYDANGNRLTHNNNSTQIQYGYDLNSNRMNWYDSAAVLLDNAGNTLAQGGLTMTYNQANRLETVGTIGPFAYHANGLRITKPSPNSTTIFHYDLNGQLIAETNDAGSFVRAYFWADEIPMAQFDTQLTYLHVDHLNTPRMGTNDAGSVVWSWHSDGFGNTTPNEDPDGNGQTTTVNLRFPGQYYDVETGLHYNYFRDYSPQTGRYIQSDPIGLAGGMNTYGYVGQNPLSFVDVTGENPILRIILQKAIEKGSKARTTKKGANRLDNKQVRDAANEARIPKDRRRDFGDFIEEVKAAEGRGGRKNFTYEELLELAKEFKETQCK